MSTKKISRREMLKGLGLAAAGTVLAACTPEVIKETVEVEKIVTKEVEKIVTKEVEKVVTAPPAEVQKVVMEVWANDAIWPIYLTLMLEFTRAHPEVEIDTNRTVGGGGPYYQKMLAQFAAGDVSDVIWTKTSWFSLWAERDVFLSLDDFIAADKMDLGQYFSSCLELAKFNGQQMGMPAQAVCSAVYYNKSHFDNAGLAYPSAGWTWDDMLEKALATTKGEGPDRVWGFPCSFWGGGWFMPAFVWSNGGEYWDEAGTKCLADSDEFIEAAQFYCDLSNKHNVAPTAAAAGADPFLGNIDGLFAASQAAMVYTGTWSGSAMLDIEDFDWDIVVAPVPKSGDMLIPASTIEGPSISKTTKVAEAAWKWVKFITGPEGSRIYVENGFWIPSMPGIVAEYADYMGKNWQAFSDVLTHARKEPLPFIREKHPKGGDAWWALSEELGGGYGGAKSVEAACKDGTTAANEILQSS